MICIPTVATATVGSHIQLIRYTVLVLAGAQPGELKLSYDPLESGLRICPERAVAADRAQADTRDSRVDLVHHPGSRLASCEDVRGFRNPLRK
jgi:hypothetical protein